MEHYWKALAEQVQIVGKMDLDPDAPNLEFIRMHALSIVQLCDAIMFIEDIPLSSHEA